MKKKRLVKKMMAAITAISLGLGMTATSVMWQNSTVVYADENFTITDGVLISYNGTSPDVVIPDGVTSISFDAFANSKFIESVVIPGSVTSIPKELFKDCTALNEVIIEDGVEIVSEDVLDGCDSIKKVKLPKCISTCIGSG